MRRFNLVPNPRQFVGKSPADSEHYLLGSLSAPQQRWIVLQRVSVAWCVVSVACCRCMLHAAWCLLQCVCCMLHVAVALCLLHAAWCLFHVACCMVSVAWCLLHVAWCLLHVVCCHDQLCAVQVKPSGSTLARRWRSERTRRTFPEVEARRCIEA